MRKLNNATSSPGSKGAETSSVGINATHAAYNANRRKKIAVGVVLVTFIVFVIVDSFTNKYVKQSVDIFLNWIGENPVFGLFAFMGVYFIATVLFVPGSILTLGCGFVFAKSFGLGVGVLFATIAVFFGASAGAIASFILGRYLLREWVNTLTRKYPIFEAIDTALGEKGFRIMALLRLSPIIPFNALNYIAGVTAISMTAYSSALIAILPGTVLYIFLGASAGSLSESGSGSDNEVVKIVTIVFGITFGFLGIFATSYYAKKELNKVMEREESTRNATTANNDDELMEPVKDVESFVSDGDISYGSLDNGIVIVHGGTE